MRSPLLVLLGLSALATSSTTSAIAVSIGTGTACTCGTTVYPSGGLAAAHSVAVSAIQDHRPVAAYPKAFANSLENLKFTPAAKCGSGPYLQFPLTHSHPYKGGSLGPDRIVLHAGSNAFCGCITHVGAHPSNLFVLCKR
ncbi:hypothetical protein BG006_000761 [Podila minutissima]|uniref:Uncharacterized protein n=1 Tax=Podila minutissima TaxID=64525 RepID=A0A9P5SQD1_9FUNG|nr:hypothetical protein BG006_000761 [Podila minutissima]